MSFQTPLSAYSLNPSKTTPSTPLLFFSLHSFQPTLSHTLIQYTRLFSPHSCLNLLPLSLAELSPRSLATPSPYSHFTILPLFFPDLSLLCRHTYTQLLRPTLLPNTTAPCTHFTPSYSQTPSPYSNIPVFHSSCLSPLTTLSHPIISHHSLIHLTELNYLTFLHLSFYLTFSLHPVPFILLHSLHPTLSSLSPHLSLAQLFSN